MFFGELILAFVVALIISLLLGGLIGWERPGAPGAPASILFLFVIIFLATWAGGVWLVPFGPLAWGVAWLPFLLVALFVALLIFALVPPRRFNRRIVTDEQEMEGRAADEAEAVLGGFFWAFIVALVAAVAIGYIV